MRGSHRRRRGGLLYLLPIATAVTSLIPALPGRAAELTGQLASELYIYQQGDFDHVRPYERLRAVLVAWRGTQGRRLSVHTSLRWTTDLADRFTRDPQLFIYNAYARFSGANGVVLDAGRQFVYVPVGSVHLDGARLRYRFSRRLSLEAFGGSHVARTDPERVRSLSDYGIAGARLSTQVGAQTRLGASWLWQRDESSVAYHRVGLDAEHATHRWRLYGRGAYDHVSRRVGDLLGRVSYTSMPWHASAEFSLRDPSVRRNSLFSLVDFERYRELRASVQRRAWGPVSVVAQADVAFFDPENSWHLGLGIRSADYGLMWRHRTGHRGDRDGLDGYLNLRLNARWTWQAQANVSRYRVQDEQVDRSDAHAAATGFYWRPGRNFGVRAEVQYLRNAVDTEDVRLFVRVSKDFTWSPPGGAARR